MGRSQAAITSYPRIAASLRFEQRWTSSYKPPAAPSVARDQRTGERISPREGRSVTWVYALPAWAFYCAVLAAATALSTAGLLFARRIGTDRELTHNDVAGPIIGTLGTILAVIVSFLLVSVWQGYDGAAATVAQEASAVADLDHLALHFPPSLANPLQSKLKNYVSAVIDREWPAMRVGDTSPAARLAAHQVLDLIAGFSPASPAQQTLQQQALTLVMAMQDARRNRLFDNQQGIPIFFWVGNVLLAAITVGFCFLFRVRSALVHLVMTLALSTVIATTFCLIALFDYPFRGGTQLPPREFVQIRDALWTKP